MDKLNQERLDRSLRTLIGANQPLCKVYTFEDVLDKLFDARRGENTTNSIELDGLISDATAEKLNRGFRLHVVQQPKIKTVISW